MDYSILDNMSFEVQNEKKIMISVCIFFTSREWFFGMDEKKINDSGIEMNVCATHDNRSSSLIEEDEDEKYILEEVRYLFYNIL